jgi:hypothetical protein
MVIRSTRGTHIVSGGGLEWLQWDQTLGRSVDAVLTDPLFAGWRLANNNEMASLFNAFTLGVTPWDTDPTTEQIQKTAWDSSEASSFNNFLSLFSLTYNSTTDGKLNRSIEDPLHGALAWYGNGSPFGDPLDPVTGVARALVNDDFTNLPVHKLPGKKEAGAELGRDQPSGLHTADVTYSSGSEHSSIGVALVRVSAVPGQPTFAIFLLGMIGLA